MKRSKIVGSVALFFVSVISMNAQLTDRPTQADVDNQKVYIEANKEKLLGKYDEAIVLFAAVLKKEPNNHASAFELAKLYKKTNRQEKALTYAKLASTLKSDNLWYNRYYAGLLKESESYEEAAVIYENIIKKHPRQQDLYFEWAYMLIKANKPSDAIKVYNALEDVVGVTERTARRKYMLYQSEGKDSKAEGALKKLIAAFPRETRYYHYLAEFYEKENDKGKLNETYKKILEINPTDPVANVALSSSLKKSGGETTYLESLTTLFDNPNINIDLKVKELVPYIRKLREIDEPTKAKVLDLASKLGKVHPEEAKAFSVYADLLYYSGNTDAALDQYLKTATLNDGVFAVWEQIMYIYADKKDSKNLLKISEEVMDLFPNQATVYYMNGVGNSFNKDYSEAVDMFEQALMMSGKDNGLKYKLYSELGTTYYHLKEYGKSDENFEAAIALNPKGYYTINNYSYYLTLRGENLDKAKELSASVNELAPNQPTFQDTYGWIYYKLEDYQNAKKWIKKALDNGGATSPLTLEHYGDVLYQLNEVEEAVQYWQMAKDKGATSEKLDKKIADKKLYE